MTSESVKVAVRVRPFNQRELDRDAKLVIEMNGNNTTIHNPKDPKNKKSFSFDYSYWSHDGFRVDSDGLSVSDPETGRYANQTAVFRDLGRDVLNNALEGYNCSLFAYGQTGSGKSYSMVGYEANKGIVPITCDELFKIVQDKADSSKKYAVSLSMLEIYNERVRDLLSKTPPPAGGLIVRQSAKLGFYVQDIKKIPVVSYADIERWMIQGTAKRTVAATQMNATSSRAHTVITIEFKQIITRGNTVNTLESTINLIDLAGSERAESTGATGDRLKEGANINKSLSALGNVIAALADASSGIKTNAVVPYRDSILTKLLKNALGGNSKTVMIAALSPADINYDETLSTLRYADRAKRIKNKASINENPLEKLIRELKEENEKLKRMLNGELPAGINTQGMTEEEIRQLRVEIEEELRAEMANKSDIFAIIENKNWGNQTVEEPQPVAQSMDAVPHLSNLNQDRQLSGVLQHGLTVPPGDGNLVLGKAGELVLEGPGIMPRHAVIRSADGNTIFWIRPWPCDDGSGNQGDKPVVRVNGIRIQEEVQLHHGDRVLLGSNNLYIFRDCLVSTTSATEDREWDWESAMKEIAAADGFTEGLADDDDDSELVSEIVEILPMVHEVNAIAVELGKQRIFQIIIIPALAQDVPFGEIATPKVMIKMTNLLNGNTWMWEKDQFVNRRYIIQGVYERFLADERMVEDIEEDADPFWEPSTTDVLVGHAHAFLMNLAMGLPSQHQLKVLDYKGREEGVLRVRVEPCNDEGQLCEQLVENCNDLVGEEYRFRVMVDSLKLFKPRFIHGSRVEFRVYEDEKVYQTEMQLATLEPRFDFQVIISMGTLNKKHLDYFNQGDLTFRVFGRQEDVDQQQIHKSRMLKKTNANFNASVELDRLQTEDMVLQRQNEQMAKKLMRLKQYCIEWASKPEEEQTFDGFYKSVAALVFTTGNKFKVMANVIGQAAVLKKRIEKGRASSAGLDEDVVKPATITIYKKNGTAADSSDICSVM